MPNALAEFELPIRDFGAVCDISVLTDYPSLKRAQNLFKSSGLYIPTPTYSWLSRSKLIEVRHQAVKYSLINQLVRERRVYPTHLPELYDEIGRQIMFNTDHKVALTDLRGILLAAHLQLPILTFDENLIDRISKEIGIQTIYHLETHPNWLSIRNILELYRELSYTSGKIYHKKLENSYSFPKATEKLKKNHEKNIKKTIKSLREINNKNNRKEPLQFIYAAWDIIPSIQEYYDQNIVLPEVIQQICERCTLLISKPTEIKSKEQKKQNNSSDYKN